MAKTTITTTTRATRWSVALAGLALVAAACSSDATATADQTSTTSSADQTTTTQPVTAEVAGETEESSSSDEDRPDAFGERCGNDQLPVLAQLAVSADGGLRARQLPGDGEIITVLPDGTVVDTFGEAEDCGVLADGSVWFQVGTPLLATGGWVHSGFLEPTDDEISSDAPTAPDGDRPAALGEQCGNDQLPVLEQMAVNATRGLRARVLPGDGEIITTLPDGTVVDTFGEAEDCVVLADGSVWFQVGTPRLATGGWVHSGFLEPTNG